MIFTSLLDFQKLFLLLFHNYENIAFRFVGLTILSSLQDVEQKFPVKNWGTIGVQKTTG